MTPCSDVVGYLSPWRWRKYNPLKWEYPTTSLHSITTQKTTTWNCSLHLQHQKVHSMVLWNVDILHLYMVSWPRRHDMKLLPIFSASRWRKHGPMKLWYPTTSLHGVTTQKTLAWQYLILARTLQ
jgi:hypothetical protein